MERQLVLVHSNLHTAHVLLKKITATQANQRLMCALSDESIFISISQQIIFSVNQLLFSFNWIDGKVHHNFNNLGAEVNTFKCFVWVMVQNLKIFCALLQTAKKTSKYSYLSSPFMAFLSLMMKRIMFCRLTSCVTSIKKPVTDCTQTWWQ